NRGRTGNGDAPLGDDQRSCAGGRGFIGSAQPRGSRADHGDVDGDDFWVGSKHLALLIGCRALRRLAWPRSTGAIARGVQASAGRRRIRVMCSPSWTTSPRWFTSWHHSWMIPMPGLLPLSRFLISFQRTLTVSPILIGPLKLHLSQPSEATPVPWV